MGLMMTNARILRLFTIASRSPVLRAKLCGNATPIAGIGDSPRMDIGGAGAAAGCFAVSVVARGVAFLPQETTRRAGKSNKVRRAGRDEIDAADIRYLWRAWSRACDCAPFYRVASSCTSRSSPSGCFMSSDASALQLRGVQRIKPMPALRLLLLFP